jgi:hypothetical protein
MIIKLYIWKRNKKEWTRKNNNNLNRSNNSSNQKSIKTLNGYYSIQNINKWERKDKKTSQIKLQIPKKAKHKNVSIMTNAQKPPKIWKENNETHKSNKQILVVEDGDQDLELQRTLLKNGKYPTKLTGLFRRMWGKDRSLHRN